jgi:ATP-dependent Lon protease
MIKKPLLNENANPRRRKQAPASAASPQIELFDHSAASAEWQRLQDDFADDGAFGDYADAKRKKVLEAIVQDPRGTMRDLIVGDDATASRIAALNDVTPNFSGPIAVILGALRASQRGAVPFGLPPLLFAGPPGIGKTYFVNALAGALQTTARSIPLNLLDDTGALIGHSSSWRSARTGVIAQTLLASATASPIFIGDELDKIPRVGHDERPIDIFHTLLEKENAKVFRDQFLDFPMRADCAIWAFTANELEKIPASILDRLFIFEIAALDDEQRREFIRRAIKDALVKWGSKARSSLDGKMFDQLTRLPTRQMFRLIDVAIGVAATAGRDRLLARDFEEAEKLVAQSVRTTRVGFL